MTGNFVRYVAPADLPDVHVFTITYLAANVEGVSAPGKIEVTVVPADRRQPAARAAHARGPRGRGRLASRCGSPGAGVDPDGDAVTLLGISSAPELGRVVRTGANTIFYQSFPGSVGHRAVHLRGDRLLRRHRHRHGAGRRRTAGAPQPPLAVDDPLDRRAGPHRDRRHPGQRPHRRRATA